MNETYFRKWNTHFIKILRKLGLVGDFFNISVKDLHLLSELMVNNWMLFA